MSAKHPMRGRSKANEREGAGEARKARKLSLSSVTEANKKQMEEREESERITLMKMGSK